MKRWILDTSVGVKWFSQADEADVDKALYLRDAYAKGHAELWVPELFFIELGNALRFNSNFKSTEVEAALNSIWKMELPRADLHSKILDKAVKTAFTYNTTLYDAIFVAMADYYEASLVTADDALCKKVRDLPYVIALRHVAPNLLREEKH